MPATHAPFATSRPKLAVAGTVVTVLGLVAAAISILGLLQVLYVAVSAEGRETLWNLYGVAASVVAGAIAVVLGAIGCFFEDTVRLARVAVITGIASPGAVLLLGWTTS